MTPPNQFRKTPVYGTNPVSSRGRRGFFLGSVPPDTLGTRLERSPDIAAVLENTPHTRRRLPQKKNLGRRLVKLPLP